jgi:hypothetical protein
LTNPSPFTASPVFNKLSTSLVLVGVFVEVLRERFSTENVSNPDLANWRWGSDAKTTKLFVESGFNINAEVRGKRPGLWVDRLQNVYGKVSVGRQDQMPVYFNKRLEQKYVMGETDILIDCTSPNRGESMLLGSIVQDHIQMCSDIIMEVFALRDITCPVLGRTEAFERERDLMTTPVTFRVGYEARWNTMPAYPLINQIIGRLDYMLDDTYWRPIITEDP